MISIERCATPTCLSDAPNDSTRYRAKQVVNALWKMQHGKCCYSDMQIPRAGQGKTVEHFRPQSVFPCLRNEWINLLLACSHCNGKKSNCFPVVLADESGEESVVFDNPKAHTDAAVLDPSDDGVDPEDHLTYVLDKTDPLYGQIIPRNGSVRGSTTIRVTGIGEEYFVRLRLELLIDILELSYLMLLRQKHLGNNEALRLQLDKFEELLQSNQKFAGLAREFARAHKLEERFGMRVPGF